MMSRGNQEQSGQSPRKVNVVRVYANAGVMNFRQQLYLLQEVMENFVFPDEIKTKLMKMGKLMNIFYVS